MRASDIMSERILVLGDSISFGYGNQDNSWFDMLETTAFKEKKAFNGALIEDVYATSITIDGKYDKIHIAVGINDLLFTNEKDIKLDDLLQSYKKLLNVLMNKADNVYILSVLPVIEAYFPEQDWLCSEMWAKNEIIEKFNQLLRLKFNERCVFIDTYSVFQALNLKNYYIDAVHPNKIGQEKLLSIMRQKKEVHFCTSTLR